MGSETTASPLQQVQAALAAGHETPTSIARSSLARANGNASRNTYLWLDPSRLMADAEALERAVSTKRPPLYGVPVSLKDCFDLADTVTTAGSAYYATHRAPAANDSAMAARLRATGALITGKTHLHPLAYGITGQNPDYGDCLQPRDAALLTGGSSSGAAASVQEGSAVIAIGTDTGGSVRVPAALCGLAGYRTSHGLAFDTQRWGADGLWAGGTHLAPSFDTPGVFVADLRDLAPAAAAVFGLAITKPKRACSIGVLAGSLLDDADTEVAEAFTAWQQQMIRAGAELHRFEAPWWLEAAEIFAPIQAFEAARIHRGHFDAFEKTIADRLHWGEGISTSEYDRLRVRMSEFQVRMAELFLQFDLLTLPCAPLRMLRAAEDQTSARARILRYTTPLSLAGSPVVALPGEYLGMSRGTGVQLAARPGTDDMLLGWAEHLAIGVAPRRAR